MKLYKNLRGGAPDGPVRKGLATRDERAGLRGEYNILFDEVSYLEVDQLCMYVCSPLSRGSQVETRTLSPTYVYGMTQVTSTT
jgi:hypothetical protein